ncbi:MAG: DUF6282 family protein [Candidatus Bathyarchaeia archaeon]
MYSKEKVVERVLRGAIDIHAHTGPCVFARVGDSVDIAKMARDYGFRGIVLKNHHGITSDRAQLVQKMLSGISVYGGVVLNGYVGGLNPYAVEVALRWGGKIVWFPTQWAKHHLDVYGAPEYKHMQRTFAKLKPPAGITVLDDHEQLTPEAATVLELVKEANVALGTGHLSKEEIRVVVQKANELGIDKIIINHVTLSELWEWTIDEQKALAAMGATIEHVAIYCMENRYLVSPQRVAEMIDAVGYKNVVISSDCGQLRNPAPPEGIRQFLHMLLEVGVEEKALHFMLKDQPIRLLGLG